MQQQDGDFISQNIVRVAEYGRSRRHGLAFRTKPAASYYLSSCYKISARSSGSDADHHYIISHRITTHSVLTFRLDREKSPSHWKHSDTSLSFIQKASFK